MRRADLLIVAGLGALLLVVALSAPRWSRVLRQPVRVTDDEPGATTAAGEGPSPPPSEVMRTINVKLFFEEPQGGGLVLEQRSVVYSASLSRQLQFVVEELFHGSQSGNISPLAGNARVLEVFVTARGVAYVDISKEVREGQLAGARAELMAVYSLVNSIVLNFPAIKRVQLLIDGQSAETLAGHVDLSRPLPPDMTLLATAAVPANPEAGAPPS